MILKPDFSQAIKFLELLDDTAESFTFQTFIDKKAPGSSALAQVITGPFETVKEKLAILNAQGAGIFVTINETNGTGRKKSDIVRIRSYFAESDSGDLTVELPFEPTMVVKSKHGNHFYWVLKEFSTDILSFDTIQKGIAKQLQTDSSVCDASRVLRLPGFYHLKDALDPFMITIESQSGEYHSASDFKAKYGNSTARFVKPEEPTNMPNKGILLTEIIDFFAKTWAESKGDNKILYRAACNCKKNGYSFEECLELFEKKGEALNYNTRNQINAVYKDDRIEIRPYYGKLERSYKDLIWQSKIYKDMENGDNYIYDEEENTTLETPEQIIRETLSTKFYGKKVQLCKVEYLPFQNNVILASDKGYPILNKYNRPFWKKSTLLDCDMPKVYTAFFKHLFGDYPQSLEYVLNWIAFSLKGKNIPVLALVGTNRGIGKNVLGNILMALHGKENYTICKQSLLRKEFNMQVMGKTLVHLDEVSVSTDAELESIKAYTNKTINIEGKGVESATRPFFGNLFLTNNKTDCLSGVSAEDDRQFSVVDITSVKLNVPYFMKFRPDQYGLDWMWEDADLVERLACNLWNRDISDYDFVTNFKSNHYHAVIKQSQFEWCRLLLEDFRCKHYNCMVKLADVKSVVKKAEGISLGRVKLEAFCLENSEIVASKLVGGVRYLVYAKENENPVDFKRRVEGLSLTSDMEFVKLKLPNSLID